MPTDAEFKALLARVEAIEQSQRQMKALAKGDRGDDGRDGRDGKDGKHGKDGKDGKTIAAQVPIEIPKQDRPLLSALEAETDANGKTRIRAIYEPLQ